MRLLLRLAPLLVLGALARPALAQDETLFRGGAGQVGFYVAPVLGISEVANRGVVLGGLRAGVLIGRRLAVGLAAYGGGDRNDAAYPDICPRCAYAGCPNCYYGGDTHRDGLAYGGVELEYLWQPSKLVHATVRTLVGGGSLETNYPMAVPVLAGGPSYGPLKIPDAYYYRERESFFVAEPSAHAELNLAKHVRLAVGLGYRFTAGGRDYSTTASEARGAVGTLTLRFGKL